ncbi:MAG TPA: hypothetical protein VMM18_12925 [Gemmatimonadaceae bacterium]|nr:hypothetical protein [Gemmatimonadaceae bacterium]
MKDTLAAGLLPGEPVPTLPRWSLRPRRARRRIAAAGAGILVWLFAGVPTAAAQGCPGPCPAPDDARFDSRRHLLALGVNMALGGLSAGIRRTHHEESFRDAFWRGALGGAGTYAGKAVAASRFTGAGVIGRSVAAAGASVSRNASEGLPIFDRLSIPLGPVRVHWRPGKGDVHASVDVVTVGVIVGAYVSGIGASLDVGRTLDSGAPVFLARRWQGDWGWQARQIGGVVFLRGDEPADIAHDAFMARALGHERVHVLQHDQVHIVWNEAAERSVLTWLGAPPRLIRSVDFSLYMPIMLGLNALLPYETRPWERESHLLAGTHRDAR